jgi:hypothetical protein
MAQNSLKTRLVAAHVQGELAERFERFARNRERSVSAELRLAMREHLARERHDENELPEAA